MANKEVCPYCHKDNEGYVKMFGRFYLRKDHFNGWNLYAGKGKPLPIKYCPMCGRPLKIEQTQVNSIQDDFCGVPCKFMEDKINRLQAENENLKDILYDAEGVNLVNYWHQQCKIAENGCRNFEEENKRLNAEVERLKKVEERHMRLYYLLLDPVIVANGKNGELRPIKRTSRQDVYHTLLRAQEIMKIPHRWFPWKRDGDNK